MALPPTASTKPPTTELGTTATSASDWGWPWDLSEDSPDLQWPHSVMIYDRMRRQDSQIAGGLNALTQPIRQPMRFFVDPRDARPEVTQQIAEDLDLPVLGQDPMPRKRTKDRFSWSEHVRTALLKVVYGHMPFEQVVHIDESGPSPRARLWKLAPRFPRTILQIKTNPDGGLKSIVQMNFDPANRPGAQIELPVERLAYYCNDREGSAWQGNSVLRSCYRHWTLKDRLLRVSAMTHERNGMGVPMAKAMIPGLTSTQMAAAAKMAESYRAGDKAGGAIPYGFDLVLKGVEGNVPDALPLIQYHDTQIAKSMLEMFMQLGTSRTGSRALGSAFIDFFAMALNELAGSIADETTTYVVEDLVNWNWGEDEPAPAIVAAKIDGERDITPEQVVPLVESGAIEMDDDLEAFLRQRYGMPPRNFEEPARTPLLEPNKPVVPPGVTARRRRPFRY